MPVAFILDKLYNRVCNLTKSGRSLEQRDAKMTADLNYQFIDRLKSLPFIEAIYLYGSRARNSHRPRSDIDLAIVCPQATDEQWQQVIDIIEEADTLLEIDFLRLDKLQDIRLKQNIERDKKIIFSRKESSHGST